MKIAIYGDSFAAHHADINRDRDGQRIERDNGKGWPEILADQHEVQNFGESGTAFMFSYELFLKNYKNFDLNIFVPTVPSRLYVKALDGILVFGLGYLDFQLDRLKKIPFYDRRDTHLEILKSVRVYLELWVDDDIQRHIQHGLINNLWNLAPNTLIVPGFEDSIEQTTFNLQELARYELSLIDKDAFSKFNIENMLCKRKCHFSEENNKVIAKHMLSCIESGEKIFVLDKSEILKPSREFSFYVEELKL